MCRRSEKAQLTILPVETIEDVLKETREFPCRGSSMYSTRKESGELTFDA